MSASSAKPWVLVVDDDELVLRGLARQLRRSGTEVVTATSAETALAVVRDREPPVAVISDYLMHGRDGLSMLDEIRARAPTARLALHTGTSPLRLELHGGDVLTVFTKPTPFDQLEWFVDAAIQSAARSS